MTFPIVVTMLGHPRGKGSVRRDRMKNGAFVTHSHPASEQYEGNLRIAAAKAMEGRTLIADGIPLRVFIEADFPIPTSWSMKRQREALLGIIRPTVKPDWDNIGKICDGCNTLIWKDDKQIAEGCVVKRYSEKPMLRITVWPLTPAVDTANAREKAAGRAPSYMGDLFAGLEP
jgi:Holliday junction resolvase RusA-like endonuclease